jgi:hypothetical protein
MMLADADIGQLPPGLIKDLVILFIVGIGVICAVVVALFTGLQYLLAKHQAKKSVRTEVGPQPFEVAKAPKRFNWDFENQRHVEIERRLNAHDLEIERLRTEDMAIRADITEKFQVISLQLGKIIGKLEGINQ